LPCRTARTNRRVGEGWMISIRCAQCAICQNVLWRSSVDSKAAGAWAIPTALPSSPIQLPSFCYDIRWAPELKDLPKAPDREDSQADPRIILAEFGRLRPVKWQCRDVRNSPQETSSGDDRARGRSGGSWPAFFVNQTIRPSSDLDHRGRSAWCAIRADYGMETDSYRTVRPRVGARGYRQRGDAGRRVSVSAS